MFFFRDLRNKEKLLLMRWDVEIYIGGTKSKLELVKKIKINEIIIRRQKKIMKNIYWNQKMKFFLPKFDVLMYWECEKEEERNVLVDTDYTHCIPVMYYLDFVWSEAGRHDHANRVILSHSFSFIYFISSFMFLQCIMIILKRIYLSTECKNDHKIIFF